MRVLKMQNWIKPHLTVTVREKDWKTTDVVRMI